MLCETWLINDFEFKLNIYKTINSKKTLNKNDEVTVLIRESLNIITIEKLLKNCNSVHLTLMINNALFSLFCTYISHNNDVKLFIHDLELLLSQINKQNVNIICGGINIDIMENSNISNNYLNIMALNGFLPYRYY